MAAQKLFVEVQDEQGNIYYVHTSSDVVFCADGETVEEKLKNATPEKDGRMSAEDKKKLDGIAEGANKYVHPTGSETNIFLLADLPDKFCGGPQMVPQYGVRTRILLMLRLKLQHQVPQEEQDLFLPLQLETMMIIYGEMESGEQQAIWSRPSARPLHGQTLPVGKRTKLFSERLRNGLLIWEYPALLHLPRW